MARHVLPDPSEDQSTAGFLDEYAWQSSGDREWFDPQHQTDLVAAVR